MLEGGGDAVALPVGAFARRQGDDASGGGGGGFRLGGFFGGGVHYEKDTTRIFCKGREKSNTFYWAHKTEGKTFGWRLTLQKNNMELFIRSMLFLLLMLY